MTVITIPRRLWTELECTDESVRGDSRLIHSDSGLPAAPEEVPATPRRKFCPLRRYKRIIGLKFIRINSVLLFAWFGKCSKLPKCARCCSAQLSRSSYASSRTKATLSPSEKGDSIDSASFAAFALNCAR